MAPAGPYRLAAAPGNVNMGLLADLKSRTVWKPRRDSGALALGRPDIGRQALGGVVGVVAAPLARKLVQEGQLDAGKYGGGVGCSDGFCGPWRAWAYGAFHFVPDRI